MMKWIGLLLLLGVVATVGCSRGPTGVQREAKKLADEKVDMSLEKAAMNTSSQNPPAAKK